jgi:uncharacterized RDD family membrane protein YckC
MPKKFIGMEFPSQQEIRDMLDARSLRVAACYKRILAYIIDVIITLIGAYFLIVRTGVLRGVFETEASEYIAKLTFVLWAWTIFPIYYASCVLIGGKTLGCWVSGITVIKITGEWIGFISACVRGVMIGVVTSFFFPFLIAAHTLAALLKLLKYGGKRLQILGWDAGSRTIVVETKKIQNG